MKKIIGLSMAALSLACLVGCASTSGAKDSKPAASAAPVGPIQPAGDLNASTKTGMDAIPADALALAGDADSASVTFASATQGPWKLNGGKNYIQDEAGNCFINVQYEGEKWDKDITGEKAALIDVNGDKVMKLDLGLNKSDDKYGVLLNVSKQGAAPKDISASVLKMRIYIPEELTQPNADGFVPTFRIAVRDTNWAQFFLNGEIGKACTFCDIGAGWHTITLDFANKTFDLGSRSGTFTATSSVLKRCNMIDFYFQGKKIKSNLDVPILIDWIDISAAE